MKLCEALKPFPKRTPSPYSSNFFRSEVQQIIHTRVEAAVGAAREEAGGASRDACRHHLCFDDDCCFCLQKLPSRRGVRFFMDVAFLGLEVPHLPDAIRRCVQVLERHGIEW